MEGMGIKAFRICILNHVTQVHYAYGVGYVLNHRQIVGYEQIGETELFLKIPEQVDDLCLYRNIQCGDGLIAQYEIGIECKSSCNTDPLALSAGELVGISVLVPLLKTAGLHDSCDIIVKFRCGNDAVLPYSLCYDLSDGESG